MGDLNHCLHPAGNMINFRCCWCGATLWVKEGNRRGVPGHGPHLYVPIEIPECWVRAGKPEPVLDKSRFTI